MFMTRFLSALLLAAVCCSGVRAGDPVSAEQLARLRAALELPGSGVEIVSARRSDAPGLLEVQFAGGPVVYATEDGRFFVMGDLFRVSDGAYVNLAEERRSAEREALLAAVPREEMIIFPAEGETRGYINVFTDVTCFYCQKLHKEVPELNRRGVEVRYLAYPRSGVGSPGFRLLASAWCAEDRQETLTRLKNRESVDENVCPGNPVAQQYELGLEVGVRGTPAIVTASGEMIAGYRPVDDLLDALGLDR
jgi:thiol:disulfide interchange protein DsbC